jgi:putative Holliday junction resolvase
VKIIGLDLGSKTLGIAISDSQMIVATGVDNFHFPENKLEFAVEKIKKVIEEYDDVGEIVLGHPLLMNGQKSKMTLFCEDFYKILKKNFKTLKIIL